MVWAQAQENLTYQLPPGEILELADVSPAPNVLITDDGRYMLMLQRDAYRTIAELSQTELRLAGLRIDPKTNIGSRTNYYNKLSVKAIDLGKKSREGQGMPVEGLPKNPRLANFNWSPDQSKIAFTHTGEDGVEVWVLELETARARRLSESHANANVGNVINWFKDGQALLVKMLPRDRKPLIDASEAVPTGPTVSTNQGGRAQNRTYQDLLTNPTDEFNFDQLARSELFRLDLDGNQSPWKGPGMYTNISFSPDGNYVLVVNLERPFSYLVPYSRFPNTTHILAKDGSLVKKVLELPLIEELPQGFMAVRTGMRNLGWRGDRPATLVHVEALDGGDPKTEVPYRDAVFELDAPFDGQPRPLLRTINRFQRIQWGNDNTAIAHDRWWDDRNTKSYLFDPSNPQKEPKIISDRSYQDVYSDPGSFVTKRNQYGSLVLDLDRNNNAYLLGDGHTDKGQFPFLDKMDLGSMEKTRLYTSRLEGKLEHLISYEPEKNRLLVQLESPREYPNYHYRNLGRAKGTVALTFFDNPYKSIQNVHKEVITYTREDGLELTGTLYLPVDYDRQKKERMPMILWAYPREYKDRDAASQSTQNPNGFTYLSWGSPIYWVSRGYVVLDDAAFPIIGEDGAHPNDSFRTQLVANAKAAVDAVDALGYIDRERVAVGGHSYGAFMVANLLSHCDLFAAGIARSGAYNRSLTPFGFQSEERNFWEAPEVYNNMSPFMHAEKMKTPMLLVHGVADNNSGTYPMQSERYFNALKGLGATVRLVMLPMESHGYRARESVLHLLWEQDQWLERYVRNKGNSQDTR